MIIYNVTVKIDNDIHDEWFKWMREKHIPAVMATGYFSEQKMCKVLVEETDGITYSIQYSCDKMDKLNKYYETEAPRLQKEHLAKYESKFVAFRTLLEVLE
ncbi:MAG: DUF4286 family protein [Flavobacteriales bacterium]|nr:DUF4286 family protein [Flavobacteriales bacterium]